MRLEFEPNVTALPLVENELFDDPNILSPANTAGLLKRGISAAQNGDRESARSLLLRVTETDPSSEDAWMWLASISEYPEELLAFLNKVLEVNPDNERAVDWRVATCSLLAKTFVQRGIEAHNDGANDLAEQCFDQAVAYDETCELAWFWKASIEENKDEKIAYLNRVLSLKPDNADAQKALESLKKPNIQILFQEAKVEAVAGKRKKALETLQDVLDSDKVSAEAWLLRSHLSLGFEEKLRALTNALEIEPENVAAHSAHDFLAGLIESVKTPIELQHTEPQNVVFEQPAPHPKSLVPPAHEHKASIHLIKPVVSPEPEQEIAEPTAKELEEAIHETVEANRITLENLGPVLDEANESSSVFEQLVNAPSTQDVYEIDAAGTELQDLPGETETPGGQHNQQTEVLLPDLQTPAAAGFSCSYCSAANESQAFECGSCHAVLSLSDIEALLGNSHADHDVIQYAVTKMAADWNLREFDGDELTALGIGHFNLENYDQGFKYLQEAARLDSNDVILAGQLNAIAIRLEEIRRQDEVHDSMPKGKTILVVDDSPTVRKLISGKLEKSGHNVVCAVDGVDGLARIGEILPDLVLLDIAMPRMDGYQVCKEIRSNPATKDIPIVMISGKDGFFDKVRGRMAGTSGYITKPFGPETLMKTLDTYLGDDSPE